MSGDPCNCDQALELQERLAAVEAELRAQKAIAMKCIAELVRMTGVTVGHGVELVDREAVVECVLRMKRALDNEGTP